MYRRIKSKKQPRELQIKISGPHEEVEEISREVAKLLRKLNRQRKAAGGEPIGYEVESCIYKGRKEWLAKVLNTNLSGEPAYKAERMGDTLVLTEIEG